MSVVPIQDATASFDCRVAGCVDTARANRGMFAYLCDRHVEQRRRGELELPDRPKAAPKPTGGGSGFAAKARELVSFGRKLDRAVTAFSPAKAQLDQAMREWREAVTRLSARDDD